MLQGCVPEELGRAEVGSQVILGDFHPLLCTLHNLPADAPAEAGHLPLQVAQARLPGVGSNDGPYGLGGNIELFGSEAVSLQLPGNEEVEGNLQLLLLGVAGKLQNLHAVLEGRGNGVQEIRRGDEHNLGEVIAHIQVMVRKRIILLRVQHLEEGRGRVAPEVGADLVHFIQYKDGVVGTNPAHALDDAAGESPHVGAAVPPDLGFVPHTPQGQAYELAPQGPGNGAPQGGLAGTRRPHEAQNGPLHVGLEFAHRQVLQNAFLNFFQVVMVLIQNLTGLGQLQVVLGDDTPRQLDHPFQVVADDLVVRGGGRGALEALQFPFSLFHGVGRQFGILQAGQEFGDFPGLVI